VPAHGPGPLRDATAATGARFVALRHVRPPPWHGALGLLEVVRLVRRFQPDIMQAPSWKAGVLGRLGAARRRALRLFTAGGWAFAAHDGLAARQYLWADRLAAPLTSVVICVGERERRPACSPGRAGSTEL
jgi:hypothetical protein